MLRLKQLRNAKNMSREELGEAVGFSKSMIAAFEQGKRTPRWETIQKLSDFFEVTVEFLMEEENKDEFIELGLVKGIKPIQTKRYILEEDKFVTYTKNEIEPIVKKGLKELRIGIATEETQVIRLYISNKPILALVALNALTALKYKVEIMSFNNKTGEYYSQGIFQ